MLVVFKVRGVVEGGVWGGACGGGSEFVLVFVEALLPPPPVFSLLDCLLPCVPSASEPDESCDGSGWPVFETRVRCVPAFLLILSILLGGSYFEMWPKYLSYDQYSSVLK